MDLRFNYLKCPSCKTQSMYTTGINYMSIHGHIVSKRCIYCDLYLSIVVPNKLMNTEITFTPKK